jgi:hypothetical protein
MSDPRKLPAQEPRVETGVIQFGDDGPGIFIRGDNAFFYAVQVQSVIGGLNEADQFDRFALDTLAVLYHRLIAPTSDRPMPDVGLDPVPLPDWLGEGTKRGWWDNRFSKAESLRALVGEIHALTTNRDRLSEREMLWRLTLLTGFAAGALMTFSLALAEGRVSGME